MPYFVTRGFGASPTGGQIISGAGGALLSAAPFTGPAAPFLAAAGAIAQIMATFGIGSGCGQTCIQSSNFANQAAAALTQNLQTYMAIPSPRPKSAQAAALQNFDTLWSWLVQQCSNPQLGSAGQNCIADRQAGACHYQVNPSTGAQVSSGGTCWNWFTGFRDPIANDPNVYDDSIQAAPTASASPSAPSGSPATLPAQTSGGSLVEPPSANSTWLLAVAAGLLVVAVAS